MTFKEFFEKFFEKKLLIGFKLYWPDFRNYIYFLYYSKYYSINGGISYRLDITRQKYITVTYYLEGELKNAKKAGNKERYFISREKKNEFTISVNGHETSLSEKNIYILRYPYNRFVVIFIGFLLIIPILYLC